jgi:hypothetical protein
MEFIILSFKQQEPVVFIKKLNSDSFTVTQESVCEFRKIVHTNQIEKVLSGFREIMPKAKGIGLTKVLFFFYLFLNWIPASMFAQINEFALADRLLSSGIEPRTFKTDQESCVFRLTRIMIEYVNEYIVNMPMLLALKHLRVCPQTYVRAILETRIGFEGLVYLLHSLRISFEVLESAWSCNESLRMENDSLIKYFIEIVTSRVFEEYIFMVTIMREVMERRSEFLETKFELDFLVLIEEFNWTNKQLVDMYQTHREYFLDHLIRFPSLYQIDQDFLLQSSEKVLQRGGELIVLKNRIKSLSRALAVHIMVDYMQKVSGVEIAPDDQRAIFDKKDILSFLDQLSISSKTFKKLKGKLTYPNSRTELFP